MDLPRLYSEIRQRFPAITEKADRRYLKDWNEFDHDDPYSWFQSLANALNAEMSRDIDYQIHRDLFEFIAVALGDATEEAYRCIDVSFVENLFWQVPARKSEPYWRKLPEPLRLLYLEFHRRSPL